MSNLAANVQLKPCPFCGGVARWCGDDQAEPHTCHLIVCTGCGMQFDFEGDPNVETVQELKDILAAKWNSRV